MLFFSLNQWLDHRLTCPQCRVKCTKKQVLKLFIDSSNNDTSLLTSEDINEVSKEELKVSYDPYMYMYSRHGDCCIYRID